jgi:cytochrome d ubiquinol oxidase subunit I
MVALGMLMVTLGLCSVFARWRGRLYDQSWLHCFAVAMGPAGFVAVLAGWVTTEVGRQPFTIYGQLRTIDAVSPLAAPAVGASLIAFVLVYFIVFAAGAFYILQLMAVAPHSGERGPDPDQPTRAAGLAPGPASSGPLGALGH